MSTADHSAARPAVSATLDASERLAALFISDFHLQEEMPRTVQAFLTVLQDHAVRARQLYLLGDLFEYWAGDDDLASPFPKRVAEALRAVHDAGTEIFWIAGNRDFLVGADFAAAIGATLLPDPHVIHLAGRDIVLTHGDALCTDDTAYMAFRAQVRDPAWQQAFLTQPLARRKEIIAGLREGSRAAQQTKTADIMDVNQAAVDALFARTNTAVMIHGHTHRPALHDVQGRLRYVLPDWDCERQDKQPARGGLITLSEEGKLARFDVFGKAV